MKLTRGKKIALTCFAVFLAFMAVCTVAARGIYASGLPRVVTSRPYSGSLTHVITAGGTVMQGQEYGVYVDAGLRVDTVAVGKGEVFEAGQELFRIETGDLETIIGQRRLEIAKLEARMADAVEENGSGRQERKRAAERAKQDYERAAVLADERIAECRQAFEAAQRALSLYDQYLEESVRNPEPGGTTGGDGAGGGDSGGMPGGDGTEAGDSDGTPGGDATGTEAGSSDSGGEASPEIQGISGVIGRDVNGSPGESSGSENEESPGAGAAPGETSEAQPLTGGSTARKSAADTLHQVSSEIGPKEQYDRQEKRLQLEQNVAAACQALAEAERQKEDSLREAARALEDANAAMEDADAEVNVMALDITYQQESLQKLEELLQAEGWIYAGVSGRVIENSLEVGGRTPDGASLTYALDDGERVLSAVFTEEQAEYISMGTRFEMKAVMPDGSRLTGAAVADYLEKGEDGTVRARFSFDLEGMSIGQSAELSYRMQTDSYNICVANSCIYRETDNSDYVYLAEEREGILGTEWKVRKVSVCILDQNDSVAAIQCADISGDARIVSGTDKPLMDGDTVRVVQ